MKSKLSAIVNKAKTPSSGEIMAAVNRGDEKVDGAEVLEKPYESQAQARYIHAKAGEGEQWAKNFVEHSHGQKVGNLPEKVEKANPAGPVREVKLDQPKVEAWTPKEKPIKTKTAPKVIPGRQSFSGVPDPISSPESLHMAGHDKWNDFVNRAAQDPEGTEHARMTAVKAQEAQGHLKSAAELTGGQHHLIPELYRASQGLGQARLSGEDPTPHQQAFQAAAAKLPDPSKANEIAQHIHHFNEKKAMVKGALKNAGVTPEHHEEIYNSAVNWKPTVGKSLNKSMSIVKKLKKAMPTPKEDKQEAGESSPSLERVTEAPEEGKTRPFIGTKEAIKALKARHERFKKKVEQDRCDEDADATAIYSMTDADVKKKLNEDPESLKKSKPSYKTLRAAKLPDGSKVNVYGNNGYERISNGPHRGRYLHSVLAEAKLGRKLHKDEEIDHKNGDRKANAASNLRLTTTSVHASHTNTQRAKQGGFTGEKRYMHSREYTEGKPESMEKGLADYTVGELEAAKHVGKAGAKDIVARMRARKVDEGKASQEVSTDFSAEQRAGKKEFPKGTGAPAWQDPVKKAEGIKKPNEMTMPEIRDAIHGDPNNQELIREYNRRRELSPTR